MRVERNLFLGAIIVGSICLLPIVVFVLTSLWPQRVLVSWLLFGLAALVILVKLALWVFKARTTAKLREAEEALRPGRLYAHERLVEHQGRYNDEWTAQQQPVMNGSYAERPYVYSPHRLVPDPYEPSNVPYSGLQPLSIDSYDWEEEK